MSIMPWVNDDVLNLAFDLTIAAALPVVLCVMGAREVIRLWRWRDDVLCGLIEPRATRSTESEAAMLATACGALILCITLVMMAATAGIVEQVQTAISKQTAEAEETRRQR